MATASMTISRTSDALFAALGKPAYENGAVTLYHRDCISGMLDMPPGIVDLTVTSPPYNIGKEYERTMELEEYLDWSERWIEAVHRATSDHGSFWLNLGYVAIQGKARAIPLPYLLWNRIPFYLIQEIVWHYGAGVAARHAFSPRNEKFLWFAKRENSYTFNLDEVRDPEVKYPNQKKNGKLKCNPLGKNPTDVWSLPKVTSGANRSSVERTDHPAQFPSAVIERIILASSNPGDLILDPFMGSGTTAIVAASLGRRVIGFEISNRYLDIAINRIEDGLERLKIAESQTGLFDLRV
jgi:adenine-specific DNA-methyltransferase